MVSADKTEVKRMGRMARSKAPAGQLYDKMRENYATLSSFLRSTRCPVSTETARKLIYDQEQVSAYAFLLIAYSLGYSLTWIRNAIGMQGRFVPPDEDVSGMIRILSEARRPELSERDRALVDAVNALAEYDPAVWNTLAYWLSAMGRYSKAKHVTSLTKIMEIRTG
jgi:hypothetical protein